MRSAAVAALLVHDRIRPHRYAGRLARVRRRHSVVQGRDIYAIDSGIPNRIRFDLERVLGTEFRIDAYQETYFVIDSFEQMFAETHKPFAHFMRVSNNGRPIRPTLFFPAIP